MIRIAICGLHIESSTFTPYMSTAADFTQRRGQTLLERYPWITESPIPGIDQVPRAIAGRSGMCRQNVRGTMTLSGYRSCTAQPCREDPWNV